MLSSTAFGVPRFSMTSDRRSSATRRNSLPKLARACRAETTILSFLSVLSMANSPVQCFELYSSIASGVKQALRNLPMAARKRARSLAPHFCNLTCDLVPHPVHKRPQLPRPRWMPQLPQRLSLNLPDAFARHRKRLSDLFQRVLRAVFQPKAHLDDLLLARCQRAQHLRSLVFEVDVDHRLGRRNHRPVLDEVAQMRIFLFANRRFEGDRLLCNLQHLADLCHRNVHPLGDFLR